jgi:gluconate 2-dehydrogenase gamma chain
MDWLLADKEASENSKVAMRGGLAWLDLEASERFGKTFVTATDAQRRQILDDIAWPKKARPELSQGVAFFNRFRDLTASGFFSSEIGYKDVKYVGNVFNPGFNGCPPEANAKLGVSPDVMKTRIPVQRS